jgi:hypothetical protein
VGFHIAFHSFSCMSTPPFLKVATAPPARDRLRREAIALRRAAHPAVVRLTSFTDLADRTELVVEHHGDATLLTTAPPDGPSALAFGASLASTVADLHDIGVVHTRLSPDHVLVAPGGRPVLTGLSGVGDGDPTGDVRALGALFELLATSVPEPAERRNRKAIATLLAVADHARGGEPAPNARDLAARLGRAPRRGHRPAPRTLLTGAGLVVLLAVGGFAVPRLTGGDLPDEAALPRDPTTVPAPATTTATTTPTAATEADPVRLEVDGAVYELGRAGDIAVSGDWDCDGRPGVALLRPDSGIVFTFDLPEAIGTPMPGHPLATVPDAVGLTAIEQPGGCSALVVQHADGSTHVIDAGGR